MGDLRPPGTGTGNRLSLSSLNKLRVQSIDNSADQVFFEIAPTNSSPGLAKKCSPPSFKYGGGGVSSAPTPLSPPTPSPLPPSSCGELLNGNSGGGGGDNVTLSALPAGGLLSTYDINIREREIFLRAALQLLDLTRDGTEIMSSNSTTTDQKAGRPEGLPSHDDSGSSSSNSIGKYSSSSSSSHLYSLSQSNSSTNRRTWMLGGMNQFSKNSDNLDQSRDTSSDISQASSAEAVNVIRYGELKKNAPTIIGGWSWKPKYVELRHGQFCYEDGAGRGKASTKKKIIILSVKSCQCRALTVRSKSQEEDCVFELSLFGGKRRLFLAASREERDVWVRMIKVAMEGSAGDFMGMGSVNPSEILSNIDNNNSGSDTIDNFNSISNRNSFDLANMRSAKSQFRSFDGPTAAFALEISKYNSIQSTLKSSSQTVDYRGILKKLLVNGVEVTVPVFYVKFFAPLSKFHMSSKDISINNVASSQVWKDLQRDSIVVNDERIVGDETGAEAMVGALMRHILDHADHIRNEYAAEEARQQGGAKTGDYLKLMKERFNLTESEALICSRDILVLCNRTQSGGDTYFCIDSLLCNNSNQASDPYCILTPHSSQADPMNIKIDIVEEIARNNESEYSAGGGLDLFQAARSGSSKNMPSRFKSFRNESGDSSPPRLAVSSTRLSDSQDSGGGSQSPSNLLYSNVDPYGDGTNVSQDRDYDSDDFDGGRKPDYPWENDGVSVISDITADTNIDYLYRSGPGPEILKSTVSGSATPSVAPPLLSSRATVALVQGESAKISQSPIPTKNAYALNNTTPNDRQMPMMSKSVIMESISAFLSPSSKFFSNTKVNKDASTSKAGSTSNNAIATGGHSSQFMFQQDSILESSDPKSIFFSPNPNSLMNPNSSSNPNPYPNPNPSKLCIRIEVSMISRYRVCDADPQDDLSSIWAEAVGTFQQVFFIRSGCNGKPLMSDRTVSISITDCVS